jgi:serine protease Do
VEGAGSGYIIDPSGYIVTNNHVVGDADRIVVALTDGEELPARVVGVDTLTDVALIKVNAPSPLPYVSFGDSRTVDVGDWVVAAGNPFGLGGTVTAGIVSARGRNIGEGPFDDFIQIDAPINPGNSGGPVFDESGLVVGMNTAIVSPTGGSVGIGFAIPSEIVSRIVADLRREGHVDRGWLGVKIHDSDAGSADSSSADDSTGPAPPGVGIDSVDRGGPAARAGLRAGDVVTAVNGQHVDSANDLIKAVAVTPPGSSVRLTVKRAGRSFEISVTVGRRPSANTG